MIQSTRLALPNALLTIRCTWQPGSRETVGVQAEAHRFSLELSTVHRVFGLKTIINLFLGSVFRTLVGEGTVQTLLGEAEPLHGGTLA